MSVNGIRYGQRALTRLPTEIAKWIKNVYDHLVLMSGLFFDPAYDGWQAVQVDTPHSSSPFAEGTGAVFTRIKEGKPDA